MVHALIGGNATSRKGWKETQRSIGGRSAMFRSKLIGVCCAKNVTLSSCTMQRVVGSLAVIKSRFCQTALVAISQKLVCIDGFSGCLVERAE